MVVKRVIAMLICAAVIVAGSLACAAPSTPVATGDQPKPVNTAQSSAVPSSSPSSPAQSKPAEPTKAEPPAKDAGFPVKSKPITMIIPFAAGGPTDVAGRLLVPLLEKDLGATITVVNKPGASTQLGITELANAKPDGYTVGFVSLPQVMTIYMDPERKSVFTKKNLQPLAMHVFDPIALAVRADSPYKSMKDLIDDAKANPTKIKGSTGGFMGTPHLAWLELEKQAGVKFSLVHFEGSAPSTTALLGGHTDVMMDTVAGVFTRAKSGEIRVLGIMDSENSKYLPGVKTLEEQGYKLSFAASRGLVSPAGTPKEVVDILSASMQKAISSNEHKTKMDEMGQTLRYMSPDAFSRFWEEAEGQVKPLMDAAKASARQ